MDRTFVRIVVVFVIGLLAGLFIGRWSAPGTWEDRSEHEPAPADVPAVSGTDAGRADAAGAPGASAPEPGVGPEARERIRQLEAEVDQLQARLDASGVRPPAQPVAWPDGRPEKFTEAGLRGLLEQGLQDCDVPAELVGFECGEPPCVALLRTSDDGWHDALVNNCATWTEAYGTTVSMDTGRADCGGGDEEAYALLSPYDHEWREELDKEESGNLGDRLQERWAAIKADWECR